MEGGDDSLADGLVEGGDNSLADGLVDGGDDSNCESWEGELTVWVLLLVVV